MDTLRPGSPEELAESLQSASAAGRSIRLGGAFSKDGMGGPIAPADVCISTCALNRVLMYDPKDLTISVGAGMKWADLCDLLAADGQMIPLDPPFFDAATVGGVVSANSSGPRRRLYGTARDVVIGMQFATLEGKVIRSGGMVVKNVAGLDMGKLMIGSFGTLAGVAVVNFKLTPIPPASRTFILRFTTAEQAVQARDRLIAGVLQPAAVDVLNEAASARIGLSGFVILIQAAGAPAVLERYAAELPGAEPAEGEAQTALWKSIREFTPAFLREHPDGVVRRISFPLNGLARVLSATRSPVLARGANGVAWIYDGNDSPNGFRSAIEFAPEHERASRDLWPQPGSDFELMKRIKAMFDPGNLLNRGRLYGRI